MSVLKGQAAVCGRWDLMYIHVHRGQFTGMPAVQVLKIGSVRGPVPTLKIHKMLGSEWYLLKRRDALHQFGAR